MKRQSLRIVTRTVTKTATRTATKTVTRTVTVTVTLALALALLLDGGLLVCKPGGAESQAAPRGGTPSTVEALAAHLVLAVHKNDAELALQLFPSREELRQAGLAKPDTDKRYAELVARARRDFTKVVAKYGRKNPQGCKSLVFSRVKLGALQRRGTLSLYDSIDVFAKCDGREIWIADPDGIFRAAGGWRLLELS